MLTTAIALTKAQQELIIDEAEYFSAQVQNPTTKEAYRRMRQEAEKGEIPADLTQALEGLLNLGLGSGRIRSRHGAHAELEASKLFRKTPQGMELGKQFDAANQMFAALEGHTIQKVSLSPRGPGMYTVIIETDEARIVTSFTQAGVDVRSVEVAV